MIEDGKRGFAELRVTESKTDDSLFIPSSPPASLATELPSRLAKTSQHGCIKVLFYSTDKAGYHSTPFPNDIDSYVGASALASIGARLDATLTHRITFESVPGLRRFAPRTNPRRPGSAPFATFAFHYRDLGLLKRMSMVPSASTSLLSSSSKPGSRSNKRRQQDDSGSFQDASSVPLGGGGAGTSVTKRLRTTQASDEDYDRPMPPLGRAEGEPRSRRSGDVITAKESAGSPAGIAGRLSTPALLAAEPDPRQMQNASASGQRDLRRNPRAADDVLETPMSPPPEQQQQQRHQHDERAEFDEMPLTRYQARLRWVSLPEQIVRESPDSRKIMPWNELLRRQHEDRKKRHRLGR